MRIVEDLSWRKFGRLTVVSRAGNDARGGALWECRCECGRITRLVGAKLRGGYTRSCGCLSRDMTAERNSTHRASSTPEYEIWAGMIKRCENKNCEKYELYGARGIVVCERWRNDFSAFLADMGPRPSPKHSIDRYPDNCGNYEPGNCRWATRRQQDLNMRRMVFVEFRGGRVPLIELVEGSGLKYQTVWDRLRRGWGIQRALTQPPR